MIEEILQHENPDNPLSDDELLAKFKVNLRYANVPEARATELANEIMEIDSLSDIRPLADALAGAAPG